MGMVYVMHAEDEDRLRELANNDDKISAFLDDRDENYNEATSFDFDKNWHAVHYLLSGSGEDNTMPHGAMMSGHPLGEDYGYGPPMMLSAADVKQFSTFLTDLSDETVAARYDPEKMAAADIYLSDVWKRNDPDDRKWVLDDVKRLRTFVASAANQSKALLWLIC